MFIENPLHTGAVLVIYEQLSTQAGHLYIDVKEYQGRVKELKKKKKTQNALSTDTLSLWLI